MNNDCNQMVSFALVFTLLTVVSQTSCQAGGVGLLPGPPDGAVKFSQYEPENPYTQLAPRLLMRTVYDAESGAGYRVEVRDLLVGPRQKTSQVSLPGAAIFEIRSGSGVITAGGKPQEVRVGSTLALSEGEAFFIENKTAHPILMRVHVFRTR